MKQQAMKYQTMNTYSPIQTTMMTVSVAVFAMLLTAKMYGKVIEKTQEAFKV